MSNKRSAEQPQRNDEGSSAAIPQNPSRNTPSTSERPSDETSQSSIVVNNPTNPFFGADNVFQQYNFYNYPPPDEQPDTSSRNNEEIKLRKILEDRAREIYETSSLPLDLDLSISFETLQLEEGIQRKFKQGHYNKRQDFEEIAKRSFEGNIKLTELFDQVMERAKNEAKHQTKTKNAHEKFVNRHGNSIVLLGPAGIGKTALAKRISQLIAEGQILSNTEYLFYIRFRDVDFKPESTMFRFLMTGCETWQHSDESDKFLVEKLQKNPNVLIILEGLHEANTNQLFQKNPVSDQTASMFVRQIFKGQSFPLAKKLITSRPTQFFDLEADCRPQFVFEILGLNQESQNKLGKQICKNNFETVKMYLSDHPDISTSFFVPANCIITFGVLNMSIEEDEVSIQSMTGVFAAALLHFVFSPHLHGKVEEVWKLSSLAWKGIKNQKIIFTHEDFSDININKLTLQSFLFTATEKNIRFNILQGDKKLSFSHLVWQELFAAINAMFILSTGDFQQYLEDLTKPLWEVVSKFIFGLTHPLVKGTIEGILPPTIVKDFDDKKKQLYDFVIRLMTQIEGEDTAFLFKVCSWLLEAHDSQLTKEAAEHLPSEIELKGSILPSDVSGFIYVLGSTEKLFSIHADDPEAWFHNDALQRMLKGFSTAKIKMELLDLSEISIDDDAAAFLAETMYNTKKMRLWKCNLSGRAIARISNKIRIFSQPMEYLSITGNGRNDDPTASLVQVMDNVKTLYLDEDKLPSFVTRVILDKSNLLSQQTDFRNIWRKVTPCQIEDRQKRNLTPSDEFIIEELLKVLTIALQSLSGETQNYFPTEVAKVLTTFAINHEHSTIMVQKGILTSLTKMMVGGDKENQVAATEALCNLALADVNAPKIEAYQKGKIKESLRRFSSSPLTDLQNAAKKALLFLERPIKSQLQGNGHVMISYKWDSQKIAAKVSNKLKSEGYDVWIDVENMTGSILDAMADAVAKSSVVLVIASQKYKDSHNCRVEGEYAYTLKKPIIPIIVEDGYEADGWLGILLAKTPYFDLSNDTKFTKNFPGLLKALSRYIG